MQQRVLRPGGCHLTELLASPHTYTPAIYVGVMDSGLKNVPVLLRGLDLSVSSCNARDLYPEMT